MPLSVEQFGKALISAGLFTADELKTLWNAIPADARPKQGDGFAKLLVQQGKLNQFQADELLSGRNTPLVMGDYVLVAELGAGGMGKVYKARHRRMERIVALKVMSAAAMQDEATVKRFQREVKAAARLEHSNIVTAYDSGEAGNVKYLVMQFVDGGDLSQLVKQNGPLEIERAVNYVLQAARGLAFAHGEGVVHRDIKPANLLLDKKGVVKILDMGLARIEGGDGLTATEQVMGTVDYMSPEQAANTKTADGRSDIYSLGCTLWFLLTAKKVYDGDTMISRLMSHRNDPLPSLVKARDDVPWSLEQAFHKMIAKSPQERFQSMDEVAAALEPFASSGGSRSGVGSSIGMEPPSAEMASFLKSIGPAVKPQAKPAPSGTKVDAEATAQFAAAGADTDPKSQLLPPPKKAAQPKGSGKKPPPNKNLLLAAAGGGVLLVLLGVWFIFRDKDGNEVARIQMPAGGSVTVQNEPRPSGSGAAAKPSPSSTVSFFVAGVTLTGAPTFSSSTTSSALQTRWPLAASKPADIQWLLGLGAKVTLRVAMPSINSSTDRTITTAADIPAGAATIVGVELPGKPAPTTDADMTRISGFGDLETLAFAAKAKHDVTYQGWSKLTALKNLRSISLSETGQFGALPDFMASLPALEYLELPYMSTDEWARVAATAPALKKIQAYRTGLTDDGLARLEKRTSLLEIDLRSCRVTQAGIDRFAAALPQCRIKWGNDKNPTVTEPRVPPPSAVPSANGVVYLDDLTEKFAYGRGLYKPGRNPVDAERLIKPFPGGSPIHALQLGLGQSGLDPQKDAVPSAASYDFKGRIVYDLAGRYTAFHSGIRANPHNGRQTFAEVWGDGKRLWDSEGAVSTEPAGTKTEVDVRGVRELTLLFWSDGIQFDNFVLLIEPRLTPAAAPTAVVSPVPKPTPRGTLPPPAAAPFDSATALKHQQAWAAYLGEPVETTNSVGQKMVLIPPGEFLMGSTDEQVEAALKAADEIQTDEPTKARFKNHERPQHKVVITKPFFLSATEVTVGQFKKFAAATAYKTEAEKAATGTKTDTYLDGASDDLPAKNISWNDATAYCQWLSTQEKTTYRLPTEAEWEYACRAGTTTQYSFGDDYNELSKYGWHSKGKPGGKSQPVGTLLPNGFGLFDMHGNLQEWCGDYFDEKWYSISPPNDPSGPSVGSGRVIRGGSWFNSASNSRSASRSGHPPSKPVFNHGFRCASELGVPAVAASTTSLKPPPAGSAPPSAVFPFDAQAALKHQEAWAKHLGVPVEYANDLGMKFRLIPPGEFQMGLGPEFTDEELQRLTGVKDVQEIRRLLPARPAHPVRITRPFYMEVEEVTVGRYRDIVGQLRPEMVQDPNAVLTHWVAWPDAISFCNRLSEREGKRPAYRIDGDKITPIDAADGYRLPTEAQWEYACRAGTNTLWYFGNDGAPGGGVRELRELYAVPNPFGLTGLYGGSSEWCWDATDLNPYSASTPGPRDDPREEVGKSRIKRGGSGSDGGGGDRVAVNSFVRTIGSASATSQYTGFGRVVLPIAAPAGVPPSGGLSGSATAGTPTPPPAELSGKLFLHDPAFPQWVKDVQAMPAEQQIEAVTKKLMELNQMEAQTPNPQIEKGVVTALRFLTGGVTDISPLRALAGLRDLNCDGRSGGKGNLFDLSPLFGMPLTKLSCGNTQVSDLSPLRGMPLTSLSCHVTPVSDLSPLHDCKNLTSLKITSTKVTPAQVAALQKALPNCKIEWDDPAKATTPQPAASDTK